MNKFEVGDEVIAYGKSYGIIKDLGDIGCLITFKDKSHHVEYPNVKKSPHQELLDLGWEHEETTNVIKRYYKLVDGKFYYQIKIDKLHKTIDLHYLDRSGYTSTTQLDLELTSILKRYLEELE